PRELLALVPLARCGTDHVVRELVDPRLDLQLVVVEGEVSHVTKVTEW
ncbi:MAG: hypothetical protein RLZ04_203, partial [Actinomycetota bacterium]